MDSRISSAVLTLNKFTPGHGYLIFKMTRLRFLAGMVLNCKGWQWGVGKGSSLNPHLLLKIEERENRRVKTEEHLPCLRGVPYF